MAVRFILKYNHEIINSSRFEMSGMNQHFSQKERNPGVSQIEKSMAKYPNKSVSYHLEIILMERIFP